MKKLQTRLSERLLFQVIPSRCIMFNLTDTTFNFYPPGIHSTLHCERSVDLLPYCILEVKHVCYLFNPYNLNNYI